ncbi:MAG: hypothetical protein ACRDNS_17900, partial [Trebonia sp.]
PSMKLRRTLALAGALAALSLIYAASALAAPTSVSVRVEGLKHTLLPAKTVRAPSRGSITKGGTPAGICRATTAAGALDTATHHDWNGSYSSGLGVDIGTILGQTLSFKHGYYWSVWVDNRYAPAGVCDLKLHKGEQLLFAPYPAKGKVFPIVVTAPKRATAGKSFRVRASYFSAPGARTKPVAGVSFTGARGRTNAQGVATLRAAKPGRLRLVGSRTGFIRSAAQTVTVAR